MRKSFVLERGAEPFPGYRLRRLLGRGSFGQVWEAQTAPNHSVAIKFLPCANSRKAIQESRSNLTVRQLRHPHLIHIDNVWCCPGYLAVAMELADGTLQDLADIYQGETGVPIPTDHLCPLLAQAADALDFLNTRQHYLDGRTVALRHCDVKPSNLLVVGETVKLSDFSLTTVAVSGDIAHRWSGTPAYAAPEVFQGRLSDRTDQYALALTFCQLRSGRLPFDSDPAVFTRDYVRPGPDLTMLDPRERPVIARALAPAPIDRWRSCAEMIGQLQGPATNPAAASTKPATDRRRTKRDRCPLSAFWRPLGQEGQGREKARIQDISEQGIGLISGRSFPHGAILVVEARRKAEGFSRPVYVRVVRAAPRPEGDWLVGCTFARPLQEDEITTLLSLSRMHPSGAGPQVTLSVQ